MRVMRAYPAEACGVDGYPPAWHAEIKHAVREAAGHRCVRCGHPYRQGEHGNGEWSPCDEECTHGGPMRCSAYGFVTHEFIPAVGEVQEGASVKKLNWTTKEAGKVLKEKAPRDPGTGRISHATLLEMLQGRRRDGDS